MDGGWSRCRCGKYAFKTQAKARQAHNLIRAWKAVNDPAHPHEPVRYYPCRFGYWHWTRQRPGRMRKEA